MDTAVACLGIAGALSEVQVLRGQHSLRGYIVGVHALPASGEGTAVEDALQAEVVGIAEDILVELHRRLFVTSEEVDLDAEDACLLHPGHLLTTNTGTVHLAQR